MARERRVCDLMDIFEPLPPEIMRWLDGETARYEFVAA